MSGPYEYIALTLNGAAQAQRRIRDALPAARTASGAEMAALFSPQLGWNANEAAVLMRGGDPDALTMSLGVTNAQRQRLTPTARPATDDPPAAGGIYVHRWFGVAANDVGEFVQLSAQAWPSFEAQFETKIFGLFQADRTQDDVSRGIVRLLLLTWYKDHGVWEASRDPTTDAMQIFQRRAAITQWTRACSTVVAGA